MNLVISNQLSEQQLKDFNQLTELCIKEDGGLPAIYTNLLAKQRDADSNVLCYENETLVGLLAVYFFYEEACEASILVAPAMRKQGRAIAMLKALEPLLRTKSIETVIFSTSSHFILKHKPLQGFKYKQSEYHMLRNTYETQLIHNPALVVRKAVIDDLDKLIEIETSCFPDSAHVESHLRSILNTDKYTILVCSKHGEIIGKAHISWQSAGAKFSNIAILPTQQGKGFGSELLAHVINHALELGKFHLELYVETNNESALKLYIGHNFKVNSIYEYWDISLDDLANILSAHKP